MQRTILIKLKNQDWNVSASIRKMIADIETVYLIKWRSGDLLIYSELLTRCSTHSFFRNPNKTNKSTSIEHGNICHLGQPESNFLIQPVALFVASEDHEVFLISTKYNTVVPEVYFPPPSTQRLHIDGSYVLEGLYLSLQGKTSGAGLSLAATKYWDKH